MPGGNTIIIGLGNPLLGDDSVGWRVAEHLQGRAAHFGVDVEMLAVGGLRLMEELVGYDRAIIVDSINLNDAPTGTVRCFPLDSLANPFSGHLGSTHETNLQSALEMGRLLGAHLPGEVLVVAIESPFVFDFSEDLSPQVAAAIPRAMDLVLDLLVTVPVQEG